MTKRFATVDAYHCLVGHPRHTAMARLDDSASARKTEQTIGKDLSSLRKLLGLAEQLRSTLQFGRPPALRYPCENSEIVWLRNNFRKEAIELTANRFREWVGSKVSHYKKLRGGVGFVREVSKSATGRILRRTTKKELLLGKKSIRYKAWARVTPPSSG